MLDAGTMTAAADAVTGGMTAVATAAATAAPNAVEGLGEIFSALAKIPGTWQTVGWMTGMAGVIALLIRISKVPLLDKFLKNPVWLRPVLSLGLGALGGFFQGLPSGLIAALIGAVAGLGAGAGAIGGTNAIDRMTPGGAAEVNTTRMIKAITHAEDTSVAIKNVAALKAELDKVVNKPAGKERLAALAKLANGLK
jgi:hypothetical protein